MPEEASKYATKEQVQAYRSPEPLQEDYTHSETGQTFRIEGISRAKERTAIFSEQEVLSESRQALPSQIGYVPTDQNIRDASWCAACVAIPDMTPLEWLRFGAEASLWEIAHRCLIASRLLADPDAERPADGTDAAEAELEDGPLEQATP